MEIDCLIVKNDSERVPVKTNLEGLKRLVEIHGAGNILNFDGSPYIFTASKAESSVEEDKTKRKFK